ncbi:tetratricopeptide repeat protein [Cyanobacteria bacterium FACHB-502]|nr:tetratricopeptide repeat protein [Leptolyngbya sp. FACHB-711]MBD1849418.1 tetratricopeptide repeat protein [Cyanobacteria bacterium FACHB-502]MBD2024114.1 tetratricopeptide repeat protein [Leptolyngbya sp. FACHB-711]
MNIRTFASQSKRTNGKQSPSRDNRTPCPTGSGIPDCSVNRPLQRRWQSRFTRKQRTADFSHTQPTISRAEQDQLLRQEALTQAQQGHFDIAVALFSELIERYPNSASDYSNRGLVYFQSGQLEAAIEDYNRAIELNPQLDSAYNNRANYYAAQGQFLEAILDYDVALDLNPANVRVWINQGITFRELEMYDRALESFELALCLGRLEGHIYAERGRTYHLRGDWNCAVGDYHRAIEALPATKGQSHHPSARLRHQVESWMGELLYPFA